MDCTSFTFQSAFSPGWTWRWPAILQPAQWPVINPWKFKLELQVLGKWPESIGTIWSLFKNLIEAILATIGDVHKFDNLGLCMSNLVWVQSTFNTNLMHALDAYTFKIKKEVTPVICCQTCRTGWARSWSRQTRRGWARSSWACRSRWTAALQPRQPEQDH